MLANRGYRVGVFDTDLQSPGIHVIFDLQEGAIEFALNHYLWGKCRIEQAAYEVYHAAHDGGIVYLVPASIKANDIARVLRERYDANQLQSAFRELIGARKLDFVFIDTHPGLNEETLLSIAVSDILLIVLRPDQQDFQGTAVTVDIARRLKVAQIALVVNKIPSSLDSADVKAKVEQTYNCPAAALLPLSVEVALNASSGIYCMLHPDDAFSQGIAQVVQHILK